MPGLVVLGFSFHKLFGQREHTEVIGQAYYSPVTATDSTSLFLCHRISDIDCCIRVSRMSKNTTKKSDAILGNKLPFLALSPNKSFQVYFVL